jgi:hypothetical protein
MQKARYRLQGLRIGALPILNRFIARMGLDEQLTLAVKNPGYGDALLALLKNILDATAIRFATDHQPACQAT